MFRRLFALTLLATALAGLAGCGDKEATVSVGESEAIFVTLGDLQYQVQMSRQLNPADSGDSDLLAGIDPAEAQLGAEDLWFGVWVRAFNSSAKNVSTADIFKIADTRGEEFEPVIVDESNKLVFRKAPVEADGGQYPNPNSAAANLPTTGAILIFKLPNPVLNYRPLELEIESSDLPGKKATVTLDV
ncbi:MAG: hypothetical protein NWQ82_01260 [Solirubrobacteraceae bacterium]|jgi:hypothetical protein|nr:hypothetical protein [Solirubrobacteraceae bacterium]MDP4920578.1 hypothetical protein [Solirubrobacteraceae bacterium]